MMTFRKRKLVLASASPRRRALLAEMGYTFEVVPAEVDETLDPAIPPERQAELLAERKALAVAAQAGEAIVLGADTLVACEGRVIGKAADATQAREFLRLLTAHRHAVITGLCTLDTATGVKQTAHDVTWVTMHPMSEAELDAYIASCGWRDKAGAYAIQEGGDRFIDRIEGSETNVIGLPTELVADLVPYSFREYLNKLHHDTIARHRAVILTAEDIREEKEDLTGLTRFTGLESESRVFSYPVNPVNPVRNPLVFSSLPSRYANPAAPLEVEIGPGKDDFTVRSARAAPEANFLAIERFRERVDVLCTRIERARLRNACVFFGDARLAVARLLRSGQVRAFYIHFPDPYPKRRHAKHRLLQPSFVALLADRLAPGGKLTIITDVRPYAEQILPCLESTPGFLNRVGPGQWATELPGYHQSVYERKRRAAGCVIYYVLFEKREDCTNG